MIYLERISDKDYSQSITGKAYKVFEFKDGKLYPPMVANAGNSDTPIGVWLDAESGEFIELEDLKRVVKRGSNREKLMQRIANLDNLSPEDRAEEVRKIRHNTLAYRPGWHLGDYPRASQFDSEIGWEYFPIYDGEVDGKFRTFKSFVAKGAVKKNYGKVFYIEELDQYALVTDKDAPYFPYDFIWAECDYVADIDYQEEAMSYGYRKGSRFQHSLAGLPRVPEGGSYRYRTNPRPDTVPWVITGAMKVSRLLDDYEVSDILLANGIKPIERQGGDKTLAELGF